MVFVVPFFNKDIVELQNLLRNKINEDKIQKRLVLCIVSIALLLDNMLYMVIVPIMPTYLRRIKAYHTTKENVEIKFLNGTLYNHTKIIYKGEDEALGYMFAIKAIVQLLVNPFSGTLIDRIGYEMPLIIGLLVLFTSTAIFALGRSYSLLFFARSLQGMGVIVTYYLLPDLVNCPLITSLIGLQLLIFVHISLNVTFFEMISGLGSAFADTSGLAMIADRFTEEHERSKAMGIGLAFISFGSLVAPPFGGVLYKHSNFNHAVPFMILSLICLLDGFMVFMIIRPKTRRNNNGERIKGTPIWRLFLDPYVAVCSGALIMANVSLAFLEPTISIWMNEKMPNVGEDLQGLIWLPAFFPHVLGVYLTVVMMRKYPAYPWLMAAAGLVMEGLSCFFLPFSPNYWVLIIPLCVICFGIALIDTALLPMLGYLVDTRHVSVYGSVYAIADISYSLAYAFGPMVAGNVLAKYSFFALNFGICASNILYAPVLYFLRTVYAYKPFENVEEHEIKQVYGSLSDSNPTINDHFETNYNLESPSFQKPSKQSYGKTLHQKAKKQKNTLDSYQYKDTDEIMNDVDDEDQD